MNLGSELTWQATVAANLFQARKRNGRIGSRKSRAGCLTCKTRRVKCDERKPECERCVSTGRKCDGYALAIPKKTSNSLVGGQLSQALGLQDSERRTFDYFLSWTAPRLAGPMDKFFWCGQVLQLAQAEPVVLNSLLAISTLYEHPQFLTSFHADPERASNLFRITVPPANKGHNVLEVYSRRGNLKHKKESHAPPSPEIPPHPSIAHPPISEQHINALRYYNRAICAFKHRMDTGRATPWLALLSCVLFICIELLRDNVFEALNLFSKGLSLLKQVSGNQRGTDVHLLRTLKLIFGRLGVMAAVFGYPLDVPQEFVDMSAVRVFTSLEEARTALWALMFDSHAFIRDAAAHKANIGYEEPQDPLAFNAVTYDPMAETSQAVLPPRLGVRAGEPVTRLYVGCIPEDPEKPVAFDIIRDTSIPTQQPSSSQSKTRGVIDITERQNTSNTSISSSSQEHIPDSRKINRPLSSSSSLSVASSSTIQLPATPTAPLTPPQPSADASVLDPSERTSWWVPPELLERQTMLERRLGQWNDAFHWVRGIDEEAASSLLMHYHVSLIWQTTRLSPDQMVFDRFTFHFQQIFRLAEIFIKSISTERPTFTFEIGVVPQLYFLVTKCRVPSLRRKALELMTKAPRKECMFGSKSCAELAARLVAIEEEGLGLSSKEVDDSVLPPEENRVQTYEILQDNIAARYEVRVTRYRVDESGRRKRTITDYLI